MKGTTMRISDIVGLYFSNTQKQKLMLMTLCGMLGALLCWMAPNFNVGFLWWILMTTTSAIFLNTVPPEPTYFIWLGSLISTMSFVGACIFRLFLSGEVVISYQRFELGKMGLQSWSRIALLLLVTVFAVRFISIAAEFLLAKVKDTATLSQLAIQNLNKRIKIWTAVIVSFGGLITAFAKLLP
jgi:hypothetical protein